MARYAIIENGTVANIAVHSTARAGWVNITGQDVHIGDLYDGQTFTRPAPSVPVPAAVTRRQAKQALLLAGLLDDAETAINAIPDATERALAMIFWNDADNFERANPLIAQIGGAIGLTSEEIDARFILAATL